MALVTPVTGGDGPALTPAEREAMALFWGEYDAQYGRLQSEFVPLLYANPAFAKYLNSMPKAEIDAAASRSHELMGQALRDGDWKPYLDDVRATVVRFTGLGVDLTDWVNVLTDWHRWFLPLLAEKFGTDPKRLADLVLGAVRFSDIRVGVMVAEYVRNREDLERRQQVVMRELSTPVLLLRAGVLLLPVIGALDSDRARQLTEQLLAGIRAHRARVVVMDITGVPAVDTRVANHFFTTVEAARLMGAVVVVTGLSAEVAQALAALGLDLSRVRTVADLQGGVDEADRILGYTVTSAAGRKVQG